VAPPERTNAAPQELSDADHVLLAHLMVDPARRVERLVVDFTSTSEADDAPTFERFGVDRRAMRAVRVLSLRDAEVAEIYLHADKTTKRKDHHHHHHKRRQHHHRRDKAATPRAGSSSKASSDGGGVMDDKTPDVVLVVKRPRDEVLAPEGGGTSSSSSPDDDASVRRLKTLLQPYFADPESAPDGPTVLRPDDDEYRDEAKDDDRAAPPAHDLPTFVDLRTTLDDYNAARRRSSTAAAT